MTNLAQRMNSLPVFCTALSLRLYSRSLPNRLCHSSAIILSIMPEYLQIMVISNNGVRSSESRSLFSPHLSSLERVVRRANSLCCFLVMGGCSASLSLSRGVSWIMKIS